MSEGTAPSGLTIRRKEHPVLLTLAALLCFAGLLVYRVWYSCLYLGAAGYPDAIFTPLAEAGTAVVLLLIVLLLRQDFTLSAALPLCFTVIVFMLLSFIAAYGSGFIRWLNIGPVMLYLPPFLLLLFLPLSAFTAAGRPIGTGRAFLLFLLLGVIPVGLMFLSGDLEFVTVYLLVCILFALYIRKNGCLDVPGVLFWLVTALVLAAIVVLYALRLREHFDVLLTRGRSDPEGYGILLMQVDSIWQQIRWLGPSPLLSDAGGLSWYTANAGYELIAVMIRGGAAAMAGLLICALGLVVCLYRMHAAMQNPFARFVSFLTATVFLVETVWNLFSCFLGISARSDIPFLSANRTVFFIEILLLGTVFSLFRQRRLPLAEMNGDYWFRGSVAPAEPEAPVQPEPPQQPSVSFLRSPALKRYLHPDRFYLDTHMDMAAAEWRRIREDALASGAVLPEELGEELLPLCLLDGRLYLLIPSQSPRAGLEDPAADLAPLLEQTPYVLCFVREDPLPPSREEPEPQPESPAEPAPEASDEAEAALPDLNFASAHEPGPVPDFSFSPVINPENSEE